MLTSLSIQQDAKTECHLYFTHIFCPTYSKIESFHVKRYAGQKLHTCMLTNNNAVILFLFVSTYIELQHLWSANHAVL